MWKTKFLKWAYELNTRLKLPDIKFVSGIKRWGKRFMFRVLAPNKLMLVNIHGMPFYIHSTPASIQEYILQPYEPYTTELFKRAVKPGAVVVDIGAQFGHYSLLAANSSGPEGRVFAFEPVPGNFEVLKRNIQVNRYTDIIYPIPKAVGVRPGMISIFLYKNSDSHGMFGHPHVAAQEVISVECVTIDEFLAERPVDVIKMDIEGNEPYALKGMAETISKNNNLILFTELAPLFLRRAGVEPKDYVLQLEQLGFDVRLIDEHSRCLKPITEDLLAEDDPSWHANLYCIKRKNG